MSTRMLLIVLVILLGSVTCAPARNFLPLDPADPNSDHWYFAVDDPNERVHRYSGEPAMGYATHHIEGRYNDEIAYHTVWLVSHDADGNTWIHGQSGDGGENYEVFTPAMLLVDADVAVGLAWSWESADGQYSAAMECTAEEDIEGDDCIEHHAFAIQRTLTWPTYTFEATTWFADGFGIMRFIWGGYRYELDICVATNSRTLSSVKSLFR